MDFHETSVSVNSTDCGPFIRVKSGLGSIQTFGLPVPRGIILSTISVRWGLLEILLLLLLFKGGISFLRL